MVTNRFAFTNTRGKCGFLENTCAVEGTVLASFLAWLRLQISRFSLGLKGSRYLKSHLIALQYKTKSKPVFNLLLHVSGRHLVNKIVWVSSARFCNVSPAYGLVCSPPASLLLSPSAWSLLPSSSSLPPHCPAGDRHPAVCPWVLVRLYHSLAGSFQFYISFHVRVKSDGSWLIPSDLLHSAGCSQDPSMLSWIEVSFENNGHKIHQYVRH